jgi:hypothetical protein
MRKQRRRQVLDTGRIARHLGHDRKTIRAYLAGGRVVGEHKPAGDDPFEPYVDKVRARLEEGPTSVGGDVVRRGRRPRPTYRSRGCHGGVVGKYAEPDDARYLPTFDPDFDVLWRLRPRKSLLWQLWNYKNTQARRVAR